MCSTAGAQDDSTDSIKLKINDSTFNVKLEDNSASKELLNTLKKGDIVVEAVDYGNFEKVGSLGFSLPTSDEQITTSPGDIVLYRGNQISLFYDSHSWSYTKLGKIQNVTSDELKDVLGSGDVKLTLSIAVSNEGITDKEKYKSAMESMDIVLGRGGDQAVLKENETYKYAYKKYFFQTFTSLNIFNKLYLLKLLNIHE